MRWCLGIIAKAPQQHIDAIERALYRQVKYASPSIKLTPKMLSGDEELAFKDLDPAHIVMVSVRAVPYKFSKVLGRAPIGVSLA